MTSYLSANWKEMQLKFIKQERKFIQGEQCVTPRLLYELRKFITEGKRLPTVSFG
jgi:hypothetical protein